MSEKYCCENMETAIKHKFLVEKNGDILINIEKHPVKAGNVLTGETYDPKDFIMMMALEYCPFCSKLLVGNDKCEKSPIGEHCWHTIDTHFDEMAHDICCWCGKKHQYTIPTTISYSCTEHGEYYQTIVW